MSHVVNARVARGPAWLFASHVRCILLTAVGSSMALCGAVCAPPNLTIS